MKHFFRPKFWVVVKSLSCQNFFLSTNAKLGARTPTFSKIIKILSTRYFLCQKLAVVCLKMAAFPSSYFFNPRRRWFRSFWALHLVDARLRCISYIGCRDIDYYITVAYRS